MKYFIAILATYPFLGQNVALARDFNLSDNYEIIGEFSTTIDGDAGDYYEPFPHLFFAYNDKNSGTSTAVFRSDQGAKTLILSGRQNTHDGMPEFPILSLAFRQTSNTETFVLASISYNEYRKSPCIWVAKDGVGNLDPLNLEIGNVFENNKITFEFTATLSPQTTFPNPEPATLFACSHVKNITGIFIGEIPATPQ